MKKSTTIYLLISSYILLFSSCSILKNKKIKKQGTIVQQNFMMEIPFDYVDEMIVVEVYINNKPYNLIYDTGAELIVIDNEYIHELQFKEKYSSKVGSANKQKGKLSFFDLPPLKIGDLEVTNLGAAAADLKPLTNIFSCKKTIHGLLGNNLFRKAFWRIDYQNKKIQFSDDLSKLEKDTQQIAIPMDCGKSGNGYVQIEMYGVKKNYTFDTGYNGGITANTNLFKKLKSTVPDLEYAQSKGLTSTTLFGQNFGSSYPTLIKNLKVGNQNIENFKVLFNDGSKYGIGNEFWENYTIITDWDNCMIYLSSVQPIKIDTIFGYEYYLLADFKSTSINLQMSWVTHSSSSEEALGAKVLVMGDRDLSTLNESNFCDFLEKEFKEIQKAEVLDLVIFYDGKEQNMKLHKEQLFPKE